MGVQCVMKTFENEDTGGSCENDNIFLDHQGETVLAKKSWVLLESCSTDSCTHDESILESVRVCEPEEELTLNTNGGPISFFKFGKMKMFPITM